MTVFRPGAANVPTNIGPSLYGVEVKTCPYHGSISRLSPAPKARFQGKPASEFCKEFSTSIRNGG